MKKKIILSLTFILIIAVSIILVLKHIDDKKKLEVKLEKERIENKIKEIKDHYDKYVVTNKVSNLYKIEDGNYTVYGEINDGVSIVLSDTDINENTKYFHLDELDLYIEYDSVNKSDTIIKSDRYKNYIPFNYNIKTKNPTKFYDKDDKYLYTLNDSYDFKVIIYDDDKYGIIYNDELLYVKGEDVEKKYENHNTDLKNKSKIRVLTYHFLYDKNKDSCTQSICQSLDMFESHLKYLRENDYFTLKLDELELYLDGKLNIPEKSAVLTIDDGTIFDLGAIALLEKYKVNATLFVITSWVSTDNLKSDYLDLESHTHHMHNQYECKGYGSQGGGILCLPEEQVLTDLKTSQEKLGGSKYLAYPFFDFNDRAIKLLKQAGFTMAFIGQYNTDGYSYPKVTDKFKVRRKTIFSSTTMDEFISYLK